MMYEILVNFEVVATSETDELAFEKCLEILLKHTKGNAGVSEKLTRDLMDEKMCFVRGDGTRIEFREKQKG